MSTDTTATDTEPDDADSDSGTTTSSRTRWPYTNDLLAAILVLSLCLAVAYQLYTYGRLSREIWMPFATAAGLASVWAFGPHTVKAFLDIIGLLKGGS